MKNKLTPTKTKRATKQKTGGSCSGATCSRIPERLYLLYYESSCDGMVPARYQGRTDDIDKAITFAVKHESNPYASVMVRMITATESRSMNSSELRELKRHIPANVEHEPRLSPKTPTT